jgi:hypothetical protein
LVSHAGRFVFGAALGGPSLEGGRDSDRETDLDAGAGRPVAGLYGVFNPGPTLFENPADTTRLLGAAIGLAGGLAPGPTVLEKVLRVVGFLVEKLELTLRVIVDGAAAKCIGAAARSERVMRFGAGGFNPVS